MLSFILIFRIGENFNRKIGWFVILYFLKFFLFNVLNNSWFLFCFIFSDINGVFIILNLF